MSREVSYSSWLIRLVIMANNLAPNQIDHILTNIDDVIRNPFQAT